MVRGDTSGRRPTATDVIRLLRLSAFSLATALVVGAIGVTLYLRHAASVPPERRPAPARGQAIAGSLQSGDELFVRVSFADANRGAVTVLRHPSQFNIPTTVSYVTSDGGRTWSLSDQVFYLNEHLAVQWNSEGSGARLSTDGGRTWRRLTVPEVAADETSPTFFDPQNAWWAVGVSGPNPDRARIWRTSDGGRSWRRVAASGLPTGMAPTELLLLDSVHGVLTMSGAGGPSLFVTEDGGLTWRQSLTPASTRLGARPFVLWPMRSADGLLLVWLAAHVGSTASKFFDIATDMFASSDRGRTWASPVAGPQVRTSSIDPPTTDPRGRLLLLDGPRLWVSEDNGASWTAQVIDAPAAGTPDALVPAGDRTLFLLTASGSAEARDSPSDNGLLRSTDGGGHWEQVPLPWDS